MKRRYLAGLALTAACLVGAGAVPAFAAALALFLAAGVGNGLAMVNDSLLIQTSVEDSLLGRVLGLRASLVSGAFTLSYLCGGALATLLGPRLVFVLAGAGAALVWAVSVGALRGAFEDELDGGRLAPQPGGGQGELGVAVEAG
jgi:MFS family permease